MTRNILRFARMWNCCAGHLAIATYTLCAPCLHIHVQYKAEKEEKQSNNNNKHHLLHMHHPWHGAYYMYLGPIVPIIFGRSFVWLFSFPFGLSTVRCKEHIACITHYRSWCAYSHIQMCRVWNAVHQIAYNDEIITQSTSFKCWLILFYFFR